MKKVLLVVLVMVLSACQKTPETESSVGMSSDDKESLVTSTPALDSSEVELTKDALIIPGYDHKEQMQEVLHQVKRMIKSQYDAVR